MGQLSNKDFLGGATAAGINELLIKQIEKASHGDPALMQWMSAAVGGITGELVSKNPQLGAGVASSGTKNNDLDEELAASNGKGADEINNIRFSQIIDTSSFDDIDLIGVREIYSYYDSVIPEEEKSTLREKAYSSLAEGITLRSLIELGEMTKTEYPGLAEEVGKKLQGIKFIKKLGSAKTLATGIVTLYLLDVDYQKENAPKSEEDFNKWLDNRVLD